MKIEENMGILFAFVDWRVPLEKSIQRKWQVKLSADHSSPLCSLLSAYLEGITSNSALKDFTKFLEVLNPTL